MLKPLLKIYHMKYRLDWVHNEYDEETGEFGDNYDAVHIDEKWFITCKDGKVVRQLKVGGCTTAESS